MKEFFELWQSAQKEGSVFVVFVKILSQPVPNTLISFVARGQFDPRLGRKGF